VKLLEKPVYSKDLWGRQPCDTEESWPAFCEYRDMRTRRLRCTTKATLEQVRKWYHEHNWKERVAAYDAHLDEVMLKERDEVLRQATRDVSAEHMEMLASAREICQLELARIATLTRDSRGANAVLKTPELIKLMHEVVKLDRLVRDQTTENVGSGIDLSKLSEEELEIYAKLVEKASAAQGNDSPSEPGVH
jgi:hypothetical protein